MEKNFKTSFLIAALILFLFFVYFSFPLLDGIAMGFAFAYVAKPVKTKLDSRMGNFYSSLVSTLIILLPVSFLMFYGLFQGLTQLVYLLTHRAELKAIVVKILTGAKLQRYSGYVLSYLPKIENFVENYIKTSFFNFTVKFLTFLMNFLISAIVCFYALCDGNRLFNSIVAMVPERWRGEAEDLFRRIDETLISLWFGNFAFAVLIGILSVPYFLIFGVPYIPMLSGLMFLAALIPVFAEWMVILPIAAFLAVTNFVTAVWFLVTGIVFMYIVPELILRPYFVGYASKIHPLLLLISFIGGAMAGGILGFFAAPTVVAVLTAIYSHYENTGLTAEFS